MEEDVYFEGTEIQLKLQKAIASLPQKQQLVFNMKYFDELTYEELSVGDIANIGGRVSANYHLAVKKITEYLKEGMKPFMILQSNFEMNKKPKNTITAYSSRRLF
ncbi:MAG: sigma-70 family RNA polymerase sigma factor [Flavobacteriaceae bacterium]